MICQMLKSIRMCVFAVSLTILFGCGGDSKPASSLKGKVTYKTEPVAEAQVQFRSPATGAVGVGTSDASGNYRIEFPLPVGKYDVTVTPFEAPPPAPLPAGYKPKDNPKIPKKYRTASTSGLTLDTKAGSQEFNIEMVD